MNIHMAAGDDKYLRDCVSALHNSELGRVYFPNEEKAICALEEGFLRKEIYVALSEEEGCLGFLWFIPKGAFHSFPYLHIIAVKEQFRGAGIGKRLLEFFEETVSEYSSKVFLVVADFNPRAKQLYQRIGYQEIGVIPSLYKAGVNECLMMKEVCK